MNERIKELAKKADWWKPLGLPSTWDEGDYVVSPEQMKKFAELIVAECIRKCDGNHDYKNRTDTDFGKGVAMGITLAKAQISTHFGVEL